MRSRHRFNTFCIITLAVLRALLGKINSCFMSVFASRYQDSIFIHRKRHISTLAVESQVSEGTGGKGG